MPDIFDRLVGQEQIINSLRSYAKRPVHAFLLVGADPAVSEEVALTFAASLQCDSNGCGNCEVCRLVVEGKHPDVDFHRSDGGNWKIDDIRAIGTESMLRPRQGEWHVEIVDHIERTVDGSSSFVALLKSVEEPAEKTIFILNATSLPEELVTIESRCVKVQVRSLSKGEIHKKLILEGANPAMAKAASEASAGSLRRARVLVLDSAVGERLERWKNIPSQIDGDISTSVDLVTEIRAQVEDAISPLKELHAEELETWRRNRDELKIRTESKDEIDSRQRRELRLFRIEELGFFLQVLTDTYRERIAGLVEQPRTNESDARTRSAISAIELLTKAGERLAETNMEEGLLLTDLLVSLARG